MKWLLPGLALVAAPAVAADGLTGDWGGARTSLAQSGVALRGNIAGFVTGRAIGVTAGIITREIVRD